VSRRLRFRALELLLAFAVTFAGFWVGGTPALDREYVAVSLNGRPFEDGSRILRISRDGVRMYRLAAQAGCNAFSSTVTLLPFGLSMTTYSGVTLMYCQGRMEIEKEYFDALATTLHWRITAERLTFAGFKGVMHLELR